MALKRINKQLLKRSIKWVIALAALTGIIFGVVPLFSYSLSRIFVWISWFNYFTWNCRQGYF